MIELLVAMAITSAIMVVLLSLVGESTDNYTRTQRAVNSLSQARAFMRFFESEISTRLPDTPLLHEEADPPVADKLAFVRTISIDEQQETTPGDLGTSAYYAAFSPDKANAVSPKLFRKVLDPVETQALLENGGNPSFPVTDPSVDEAIIANLLGFEARPKFRDSASGELRDWDENSAQPPSVIELTIRFLDESVARRYTSASDWDRLATSPTESEEALIRSFSRSIAIAK